MTNWKQTPINYTTKLEFMKAMANSFLPRSSSLT